MASPAIASAAPSASKDAATCIQLSGDRDLLPVFRASFLHRHRKPVTPGRADLVRPEKVPTLSDQAESLFVVGHRGPNCSRCASIRTMQMGHAEHAHQVFKMRRGRRQGPWPPQIS
ncbi:hypothetical protein WJX77_007871 [Trebouxia sp. C0004]